MKLNVPHVERVGSSIGRIRCDCELFAWYPDFIVSLEAQLSGRSGNGVRVAQCADDTGLNIVSPLTLRAIPLAPCSQVIPLVDSFEVYSRSVLLRWTYPSMDEITLANGESRLIPFQKNNRNVDISGHTTAATFNSCRTPSNAHIAVTYVISGFKISASEIGDSDITTDFCGFAGDFGFSATSTAETVLSHILTVKPATT